MGIYNIFQYFNQTASILITAQHMFVPIEMW